VRGAESSVLLGRLMFALGRVRARAQPALKANLALYHPGDNPRAAGGRGLWQQVLRTCMALQAIGTTPISPCRLLTVLVR